MPCVAVMTGSPQQPIATVFRPPEYPAYWWGSTIPVAMTRSASFTSFWVKPGTPYGGMDPRSAHIAGSRPFESMTRTRRTTASPSFSAFSASVVARCSPTATRIVMSASAMPPAFSSSSSGGTGTSSGDARVRSVTAMSARAGRVPAARLASAARSRSRFDPSGRSRLARAAAARSPTGVAGADSTMSTSNHGWTMNSISSCPYGTRSMLSPLGDRCTLQTLGAAARPAGPGYARPGRAPIT